MRTAQREIASTSMDTPADRDAAGLTPAAATEVSAALALLEGALPQTPGAYVDPRSGWIAQRIVGAAAAIESIVRPIAPGQNMIGRVTCPPALPAAASALGGEWITAARAWTKVADVLSRHGREHELLDECAARLREYARLELA